MDGSVVQLCSADRPDICTINRFDCSLKVRIKIFNSEDLWISWTHYCLTFPYRFRRIYENDRWVFVLYRFGGFGMQSYYLCLMCCPLKVLIMLKKKQKKKSFGWVKNKWNIYYDWDESSYQDSFLARWKQMINFFFHFFLRLIKSEEKSGVWLSIWPIISLMKKFMRLSHSSELTKNFVWTRWTIK